MKRSYTIIICLAAVLLIGIGSLIAYSRSSGIFGSNISSTGETPGADPAEQQPDSAEPAENSEGIIPFAAIAEKDGTLYTTRSGAAAAAVQDAQIIPVDSECFAIIGDDVYYITPGSEEYAPELRRCGTDGNNDISITEFVSPLGSPAFVNGSIYSAYYTDVDDGMNDGIYRYNISEGATVKAIEGEYFVHGYDDSFIYYTEDDGGSGTTVRKMDYNGENKGDVLNYSVKTDSIVVADKYLFFTAYNDISHCYKIYRSPKDGNGNIDEYSFECMSGFFDVIDDRLYYQADGSLYSSKINGSNENLLTSLNESTQYAYGFLKFGDMLYFKEHYPGGDKYLRLDMSSGEKLNITK